MYVRRIIVNLANSWWRRASRHRTHVAWEPPDRADEYDGHAAVDREDELWRALATLPAGMRAVIVLRYYEELTEAETAALLGKSLGTVKSQASRGLVRMREALSESRAAESRAAESRAAESRVAGSHADVTTG